MFNSSKIGDVPRSNKNNLHKTLNETANGVPGSFLQPKITSTPLVRRESVFATPPKPHLLSPRRYSLSEIATPPRTNKKDLSKLHNIGPLLASTRYNLNVSTYEDTKSPGLAGRIVQYNEETQKKKGYQRPPTHQAKYASPGIFPVVHLFKKKLPPLEKQPRTVTIRIASPEYSRHHSQEYNRILLEGIIKPNSPSSSRHIFASPSGEGNNTSTRSVLEALKEISRKRIHANEEYELNEDTGKRLRTENFKDMDTNNKRLRDESPLFDNSLSPNKSSSKRICMYDEYAASCSSMNFSFKKLDQPVPKRKSISISTLTENPVESKQVKLINAETQTIPSEVDKTGQLKESTTEQVETNKTETDSDKQVKKKESPVKVFDDAPLERIRKNRLAALMGSLAGRDPVLSPKPDYTETLNEDNIVVPDAAVAELPKATDKPLVSILSSPKKDSPQRSNKHVRFNILENTSQPNLITSPNMSFPITRSSASITSPISSTCEAKSSFVSNKNEEKLETPAPPSSPVGLTPSSSETTAMPIVRFGNGSSSSSATSVVSKESSTSLLSNVSISNMKVPNFQFKFPTTPSTELGNIKSVSIASSTSVSQTVFSTSLVTPTTSASSPPKMGGFKFDLNQRVTTSTPLTSSSSLASTTTINSLPTFSLNTSAQFDVRKNTGSNIGSTLSTAATQSSLGTTSGGISFGGKSTSAFTSVTTTTSALTNNNSFGTTTTTASSLSTSASNISAMHFKFGAPSENKPTASGFGLSNTDGLNLSGATSTPSSVSAFGTNTTAMSSTPVSSSLSFGTSKAPAFSFGVSTSSSAIGFSPATTTAPLTFGTAVTTTSSGFGIPSTGGFGVSSTSTSQSSSSFGVNTTSILGGFGTTTTATGGFGTPSTTPMFGTNKPVTPFGVTVTSAPVPFGTSSTSNSSPFNKSTTPAFGQSSTQSPFVIPSTTVSFGTANAFGGTTTTSSSVFVGPNNSSSFGKPSGTSNIFGGAANTQASGFGATTSKPLFGDAMASPFGQSASATTAPSFGSTTTSAFTFGAKTTASNTFGGSFSTTTTANTGFGSSATPAFGTVNTFGNGSSTFSSGNAFGSPTTSTFGSITTTSQPTGFGTSNTSPTFGNTSTGFSTNNNKGPIFGGSTTPAFGATAGPSFGTTTASTPGFGVQNNNSGFGTNTAVSAFAKPQTGFGSTSNSTFGRGTGFGTTPLPAPSFNSSNPPNVQTPVFNFGATSAAPKPAGVFSFGAPSTNEPLKPTFNFTGSSSAPAFGSSGTPSFGGSAAPSFGNSGTPSFGSTGIPQFNPPQPAATGMFSIGSGSSSGRTRTQLRAKRRT